MHSKKTSIKKNAKNSAKTLEPAVKNIRSKNTAKKIQQIEDTKNTEQQTASIEDFNNSVDTSFFYTNDKHLNALDDAEIVARIMSRYPEFNQQNKDTQLKKIFLQMLDDEEFIVDLLEYFNLTILDFFKVIYKNYSSLFNMLFIKKVKDKLKNCKYARV